LRTLEADVVGQDHEGGAGVEVDEDQGAADVVERVANRAGGLTGQVAAVVGHRANRATALSAERSVHHCRSVATRVPSSKVNDIRVSRALRVGNPATWPGNRSRLRVFRCRSYDTTARFESRWGARYRSRMARIRLGHARPHMHLARAVLGADGCVVAGAGTTLVPGVVRSLARLGVQSVEVEEVAEWEEDKDLARALADLEARFAAEPADPILDALKAALVRHLRTRAGDGS